MDPYSAHENLLSLPRVVLIHPEPLKPHVASHAVCAGLDRTALAMPSKMNLLLRALPSTQMYSVFYFLQSSSLAECFDVTGDW